VPPVTGGVEAVLGHHARLLRARGWDVRLIAGRGDAELVPEVDSRHPDVERLAWALPRGEFDAGLFDRLRGALRAHLLPLLADRDVVVAHNVLTMPFNLPLASVLAEAPAPVVAWTHDVAWVNPRYADYRRPGSPYDLLHRPGPGVTYVAISAVRRRELAGVFGVPAEAVAVVPNGIDALAFWGISTATRALAVRAGLLDGRPLVLVPVRLTRRKRLELAVEAVARLRGRYPQIRVAVTGPLGPHDPANRAYADELAALRSRLGLEDAVSFLYELAGAGRPHPVPDAMLAELYRLADVVLLPSESEGFGLPVLEAALSRAPLVATDLEVLREVSGGGLFTFAADAGPEAVAAAVEEALASPHTRLRSRVLARHDWPAVASMLERVLDQAIEEARAR
jgi:glycosyltransferase involved in cell wall biosynthesis